MKVIKSEFNRKNDLFYSEEHRVSLTPSAANTLIKRGMNVQVEKGAGLLASIADEDFAKIGVQVVDRKQAFQADVILKVTCKK
jgi:NAD/NADP transhydrogenase alpha subunit